MEFKQHSYELEGFKDEKQGIVVAYANAYDFKDSDGDISRNQNQIRVKR